MNQYKQLKLSVESTQQALNKLHLAITGLQNAMAGLFSAITPEMMEQIAEPDDEPSTPNTVGSILTPDGIANAIAKAVGLELNKKYRSYKFGYRNNFNKFVLIRSIKQVTVQARINENAQLPWMQQIITETFQVIANDSAVIAYKNDLHLATKKDKDTLASVVTPKSIAEAIAAATNLELKVQEYSHTLDDSGIWYDIGYIDHRNEFQVIADFNHLHVKAEIDAKTVGDWMKRKVVHIMNRCKDDTMVAEYRKRKATK